MYRTTTKKRVLYAETDKMGYLYYGHYAKYYEIGRAELIRELGTSYYEMEEIHNVMMPVVRLECKYKAPAFYDDLLTIETTIASKPTKLIQFDHKVINPMGKVINEGIVKLFFVDQSNGKRISCPKFLSDRFESFF